MLAQTTKVPLITIFISSAEFAIHVRKKLSWGRELRSIKISVDFGKSAYLDDF